MNFSMAVVSVLILPFQMWPTVYESGPNALKDSKHIKFCISIFTSGHRGNKYTGTHLPLRRLQPGPPWGKSLCPYQRAAEKQEKVVRRETKAKRRTWHHSRAFGSGLPHRQPTRWDWRCVRADRTAGTLPSWSALSQTAESCPAAGNCRKQNNANSTATSIQKVGDDAAEHIYVLI